MCKSSAGILALLLVFSSADASNWISLGKKSDKSQEDFIDVSRIRIEGKVRRAWFKLVYSTHTKRVSDQYWESVVQKIAFNCAQEMNRLEAVTIYNEDGTNFSPPAEQFPEQWKPVPPDTLGSYEMQFICSMKP